MKGLAIYFLAMVSTAFFSSFSGTVQDKSLQLNDLRCEMLIDPKGIDIKNPRLSWEITGDERGIEQRAYQVLVSSSLAKLASGEGDIWNSGKINSDQSIHVSYAGAALNSRTECFWKVKIWTKNSESLWSNPASWSMGLLNISDWKAKWMGLDRAFPWDSITKFSRLSARYFRKLIQADKEIKKATVYIRGLGLYELYIN